MFTAVASVDVEGRVSEPDGITNSRPDVNFVVTGSQKKLSVLIEGWTKVPHSFAIVNCFQLIGLLTMYGDEINIYLRETAYYYANWESTNYSIFNSEHQHMLRSIPVWNGEQVDIVYRIHFPLDIRLSSRFENNSVPMVLFYAATRSIYSYSELIVPDENITVNSSMLGEQWDTTDASKFVQSLPSNIYFVTPSPGSAHAMRILMTESQFINNHRIIPHGVDTAIYFPKRDAASRTAVRSKYDVGSDDMLFLHVGAMVASKGLDLMIITLFWLASNAETFGAFKLILKGLDDVYGSAELLLIKMNSFIESGYFTKENVESLIEKHIRFTAQTLSFEDLNDLYNAADAYWSPYAYEGFNIPVLEAIAVGLPVFVTRNGSTAFFVDDILEHVPGARERIIFLPESCYGFMSAMYYSVHPSAMINVVVNNWNTLLKLRRLEKHYIYSLQSFLEENYSWNAAARQLRALFTDLSGE
jgi:glycosyltransferase involved in cell wall biosynthesis